MSAPKKTKAVVSASKVKPKNLSKAPKPTPRESISEEYVIDSGSEDEGDSKNDEDQESEELSQSSARKGILAATESLKPKDRIHTPDSKKIATEKRQSQLVQSSNGTPKVNGGDIITIISSGSEEDSNSDSDEDEESQESSQESLEESAGEANLAIIESLKPESTANPPGSSQTSTAARQGPSVPKSNGVPKVNGDRTVNNTDDSDSGSGSSGSEEQSSSGEEEGSSEEDNGSAESEESSDDSTKSTPLPRTRIPTEPSCPYEPPVGFRKVKISSDSQASRIFSSKELAGKRLWHITTPTGIPIHQIKEASMESIAKQEIVLRHNGRDYELVNYDGVQNPTLLLPSDAEDDYRIETIRFTQSLHLQQKLPNLNAKEPNPSSAQNQQRQKPIRPQPTGLKMRYKPFGLESGEPETFGIDPPETEERDLRLLLPSQSSLLGTASQGSDEDNHQNHSNPSNKQTSTTKTGKKRKRDREPNSNDGDAGDSEEIEVDTSPSTKKTKKKKKQGKSSESQNSQELVLNGTPSKTSSQPSRDSTKSKKHKKKEKKKERDARPSC